MSDETKMWMSSIAMIGFVLVALASMAKGCVEKTDNHIAECIKTGNQPATCRQAFGARQ